MGDYRQLLPGEPAPCFRQRSTNHPDFAFNTVGGLYVVLCFFGSAKDQAGRDALAVTGAQRALFDDQRACFFGVSTDPEDERSGRVQQSLPGIRHFWDFDGTISRLYGALPPAGAAGPSRRMWVLLNPGMQVMAVLPFQPDGSDRAALTKLLTRLPPVSHYGGLEMHAPVIIVPDVFGPALCRRLMQEYHGHGGALSGFMRDVDGKTVVVEDGRHKKRSDHTIEDPELKLVLQQRIQQTVAPVIRKAFCFEPTRMERYLVGCYDSSSGGHFRPHRDNTTRGTAHRRFAVSVNLNDDFEGGELSFPEYGPRGYKMPAGCAVVFAGALLHTVSPVRRGRRYAFLPFLYDEAAAAVREQNSAYLASGGGVYKA
jgi:predicted 2-oxoglutarate/Fe(II)-dependent dioxygenase YbiX/peroxiredoxin